jgi:cellulose synthase/poly-beta-1,6-N-acetylglucosamine synthase-like glycosyltransferase
MTIHAFFLLVFNVAFIPVCIISGLFALLTLLNLLVDTQSPSSHAPSQEYPFVTVQVPSFNDPVAARCIEACLCFSYPQDRYEIMVLDDSTDQGTARLLAAFAQRYPERVGYFFRDNRAGYKPGALKTWMPKVRGDLIVIFDADFVPPVDFLESVVQPFEDPQVAIVQARQTTFLNSKENLVARFASYLLRIYYLILMPINHRYNSVFFCGTAGALRKQAVEEVGGWNTNSITEDSDLSVRLLARGYRSVYLPMNTISEVPLTIKAFLKQQMRWIFGNVRVFFDNWRTILRGGDLMLSQRLLVSFMTLGSMFSPIVLLMTVAGFLTSVTGLPHPFGLANLYDMLGKLFLTSGFLFMGLVGLHKHRDYAEIPYFLITSLTLGLILTGALTVAIYRAVFRKNEPLFSKKTSWICTPKGGNECFKDVQVSIAMAALESTPTSLTPNPRCRREG